MPAAQLGIELAAVGEHVVVPVHALAHHDDAAHRLFAQHKGRYGSPRITANPREPGWRVSENPVAALLREQGLQPRAQRRDRTPASEVRQIYNVRRSKTTNRGSLRFEVVPQQSFQY